MELAVAFDDVLHIARGAVDPVAAWAALVRYLEDGGGTPLPALASVAMDADVKHVGLQLQRLVEATPPPPNVETLYFGLFDALAEGGTETIGYYVAGVVGFDPRDGDSLCAPAWWPEGRYLDSAALRTVKAAEVAAGEGGNTSLRELLGYAGQLGCALIVSRFAVRGVKGGRRVVVGFDSGDFAEIEI